MKAFTHTFLLLLSFGLLCSAVNAQQFTVSGTLLFGENQDPTADYPIFIYDGDTPVSEDELYYTDSNGNYSATLSPETDGLPYIVNVEAFDFCTGESIIQQIEFTTDPQTIEDIDFVVCIDFTPPPPPPVCEAHFYTENNSDDLLTVNFINLSYSDTLAITYEWDFGDGNTSSEQSPTHTYAEDGIYEASLTITSGDCTDSRSENLQVGLDPCGCDENNNLVCVDYGFGGLAYQMLECDVICQGLQDLIVDGPCEPIPCYANFGYDYIEAGSLLTISFGDYSSPQSIADTIDSWFWDFGDGNTSTEQNPTHTYTEDGYYDVSLTITSGDCISTDSLTLFAGQDPCGCDDAEGDPVCYITPNGFVVTYENACIATCYGLTEDDWEECPEECECPDVFDPVCVTLDDGTELFFDNLCEAECEGYTEDQTGECENFEYCGAYAYFTIQNSLTAIFEDWSYSLDGSDITSWEWDFGDGNSSTEQNPTHTYDQEGIYIVTITITTDSNCTSSGTFLVQTGLDNCDCDGLDYDPVCIELFPGFAIPFENICFAECAGYVEEDLVDCEENCICGDEYDPVCVYSPIWGIIATYYNECQAICDGYLLENLVSCDDVAGENCYADFSMTTNNDPLTAIFEDISYVYEGSIISWEWNFGDGNASNEQNPTHTYVEEGIYEVSLTIITDEDCTSTTTLHICLGEGGYYENPDCQAFFYFEQHQGDLSTFDFIDFSFGNIDSYFWDFGDGNTSTAQNPTHTYAEEGVYTISLTITGILGEEICESTTSVVLLTNANVSYETECNALFYPFIISETSEVFFLNVSSFDAVSFEWDFGDGATSQEAFPTYQYQESGNYEVSLTITTSSGCESTYYVTIDIENEQFTGSQQFSLSSSTEDQLAINNKLTAQPNPTSGEVFIQFTAQNNDLHEINIISVEGQTLRTIQTRAQEGENQVNTNIDDLPAGLYLIQLQNKQEIQTTRIIKK